MDEAKAKKRGRKNKRKENLVQNSYPGGSTLVLTVRPQKTAMMRATRRPLTEKRSPARLGLLMLLDIILLGQDSESIAT